MRAVAIALLLLAGCLDPSAPEATEDPERTAPAQRLPLPADPMPEGAGHDHTDPSQHKFLWHYAFSARDPLLQNQAQIAGLHAIDLQAGHLFGAVYGANTVAVNGGLAIWDLSDPAQPRLTGRAIIPGAVGGDRSMEATPDGDFVVMGTEAVTCLGQVNPVPVDVYLFDTSDKTLPRIVDAITMAGPSGGNPASVSPSLGRHSIAVHNIQGIDYAFLFGDIYQIVRSETGASLQPIGSSINVGHDLYVRDTPWGDVWALTANGGGGLQVFNITDVHNPVEIGNWDLPDRDVGPEYYFHTADVGFFDDQVIVILSSEDWLDHVSPMWILDGTPMRAVQGGEPPYLEHIGTWWNPGNHTALGTSFSLHNPRFHDDGLLTISSYHGGLWQLDFRHKEFRTGPDARPAEIAYAVYAEGDQTMVQDPVHQAIESNLCGLGLTLDAPTFMDVERGPEGHLYAADVYMGLYTFSPDGHPVYGSP